MITWKWNWTPQTVSLWLLRECECTSSKYNALIWNLNAWVILILRKRNKSAHRSNWSKGCWIWKPEYFRELERMNLNAHSWIVMERCEIDLENLWYASRLEKIITDIKITSLWISLCYSEESKTLWLNYFNFNCFRKSLNRFVFYGISNHANDPTLTQFYEMIIVYCSLCNAFC